MERWKETMKVCGVEHHLLLTVPAAFFATHLTFMSRTSLTPFILLLEKLGTAMLHR